MDTKQRILDEALTLFAQKGYANVFVSEIAERVGIKAPSLYKHFKSKQAIFDAIIEEMDRRYREQAGALNMNGVDPSVDAGLYSEISADALVRIGTQLFLYFAHDDFMCRFRKLLTIEQYHEKSFAALYSKQYVNGPLAYQKQLFDLLIKNGGFKSKDLDAETMALQFYAPIYMLLTVCDREPKKERECLKKLEKHIRQFQKMYGGKDHEDSDVKRTKPQGKHVSHRKDDSGKARRRK